MSDRISQLKGLLESDPEDTFCLYGLAMEYAKSESHEEALPWFDRTLEVDPTYLYAYYHKARSLEALGRVGEAEETLRTGLDAATESGDAKAAGELRAYLDVLS